MRRVLRLFTTEARANVKPQGRLWNAAAAQVPPRRPDSPPLSALRVSRFAAYPRARSRKYARSCTPGPRTHDANPARWQPRRGPANRTASYKHFRANTRKTENRSPPLPGPHHRALIAMRVSSHKKHHFPSERKSVPSSTCKTVRPSPPETTAATVPAKHTDNPAGRDPADHTVLPNDLFPAVT